MALASGTLPRDTLGLEPRLFLLDRSALILALCDFCHARPLYHCSDGSVAERDLTAREDRFIGLCLGAAAIILLFFIVSYS